MKLCLFRMAEGNVHKIFPWLLLNDNITCAFLFLQNYYIIVLVKYVIVYMNQVRN